MVRGMFRSRTFRRINRSLPGGSTVRSYVKGKSKQASCAYCGRALHGIPRLKGHKRLSKTRSRPERPYGGVLCGSCLREEIKLDVRDQE